ncbi:DUF3040 domain-containing protein [Pseudonocardia sp. ICBG1034]|uniref:DUF3040 domain-containing protein n=1 Tax=Pseudonocardia sp. ICBG1034 TaxID=2844381 RepID=UPI001CCB9C66|nr:DUF3040 domain-containing protein [Pseudonocardia sp. ICBG1034]
MPSPDVFDHEQPRRGRALTPAEQRTLADISARLDLSDPHLGARLRHRAPRHRPQEPATASTKGSASDRASAARPGERRDTRDVTDRLTHREWNLLVQVSIVVVVVIVLLLAFTDGAVTALLALGLLMVPPTVLNLLFLRRDPTHRPGPSQVPHD